MRVNTNCMKEVSWDAHSEPNAGLNLACELVALCFSRLWVTVWGRKPSPSPEISWRASNPSLYSRRGSAQQGPEVCCSQGAWRFGNIVAKSAACISSRPPSNWWRRTTCSQSQSSGVQVRNRMKTPSVQGHLSPFSSIPWKTLYCLGPWRLGLGRLPARRGEPEPPRD